MPGREPPTSYASVSLSSKAGQDQVETVGVGGMELSLWFCCPRMPFISHRHSPQGWSPSEVFCTLSLSLISMAEGSLPRALAQLSCAIPARCRVSLPDTPAWLGCPVPTDGGGSWAFLDTYNLRLY